GIDDLGGAVEDLFDGEHGSRVAEGASAPAEGRARGLGRVLRGDLGRGFGGKGLRWDSVYSAQLLDRFYHPRWVGNLAAPSASATEGNPTCGDVVQIEIQVTDGMISVARFRTLGCAIAIAASDALCDL